ncbi:MAG: glycosyl hydrolase-related protein, partial [Candidatus Thorarchaeota archaeon]
ILYENICYIEDVGDWGDEYDFSGPSENQTDLKFTTEDFNILSIQPFFDGPTRKTMLINANLNLPASLSEDRYNRDTYLVSNPINIYISLYKEIKRIDFRIDLENNSKDHRIRVFFPSKRISNQIKADGHFYVISRDNNLPSSEGWAQKPQATNHQKDFVSVDDGIGTFAVINKGLPEYEAIKNQDNTITLAITLLRCIEWLSRDDFPTRKSNAGPDLNTPDAQCLGTHSFELSLIIESKKPNWLEADVHIRGKEFNNPLKLIFPLMARTALRISDRVVLLPFGIMSHFGGTRMLELESYLPEKLSFMEIDNKRIILSTLKKSEENSDLIIRVYNISQKTEQAKISLFKGLKIEQVQIVNLLEESPINPIKATITSTDQNCFNFSLQAHVIVTFRIKIKN